MKLLGKIILFVLLVVALTIAGLIIELRHSNYYSLIKNHTEEVYDYYYNASNISQIFRKKYNETKFEEVK